ncbi:MAG: F0F1 ATP synthase subunit B [Epulopiscium sp.]|nr:F0F1 ATP synthase subunit B [Candidatus Epulonipiscium sp.]
MGTEKILAFDLQFVFETFIMIINPVILFLVLRKLLFTPVHNFMEKRSKTIADELDHAKEQKNQAEALHQEYEEKLTHIQQEADTILETARKRAREQEDYIVMKAREEAEQIRERAEKEIKREQEKVKDDMKKEIIDVASFMTSKMIQKSLDEKNQTQLIDEIIEELEDVSWLN